MILEKSEDYLFDASALPGYMQPLAEEVQKFMEVRNYYKAAIKEVSTKLEILDDEFRVKNDYNPIHHMERRVKSISSIFDKLERRGQEITIDSIMTLTDIAGIRVMCNYIDDIYKIADLLIGQDDIELIKERDYIAEPKPNGYRSLHIVLIVPIFLAEKTEKIPVEVQIRTIAMDTWASLEHELRYKASGELSVEDQKALNQCASDLAAIDEKMQAIHRSVEK
ncbi:MAG: GTP pyrophosphokinase [Anaerovoracaceae bacterium]|jgi:putative GTP pyrophosphokinase